MITLQRQNDLLKKLKRVKPSLMKKSGVRDVGVGFKIVDGKMTDTVAFIVHVYKKFPAGDMLPEHIIPKEINGIPVDVIEVNPVLQDGWSNFNPLVGGISVSNTRLPGGGTVGCFAYTKDTGKQVGLSNYHVLVQRNEFSKKGKPGDKINQPALTPDSPLNNVGTLLNSNKTLDCAIFELNGSRPVAAQNPIDQVAGSPGPLTEPVLGTAVKKVGAATGLTYGIISAVFGTTFTIRFNENKMPANDRISMEGDSGSLWLTDTSGNNCVGLHFMGDTQHAFAMNINLVFTAMNISLTPLGGV